MWPSKLKIFVIKLLLLLCSVTITFMILIEWAPRDELSYYVAMEEKIKRLEQLPSPKIILVGGSNVTFGVDSKRIESEFDLPVVNMSLHAGLGLEFMLNQLKNRTAKGDVVLIAPEYEHFIKNKLNKGHGATIYGFILNDKKYAYDFSPYTLLYHFNSFGPLLFSQYKQSFSKKSYGVYTKVNFNETGDMIGHLKLENEVFSHGEKNNSKKWYID